MRIVVRCNAGVGRGGAWLRRNGARAEAQGEAWESGAGATAATQGTGGEDGQTTESAAGQRTERSESAPRVRGEERLGQRGYEEKNGSAGTEPV